MYDETFIEIETKIIFKMFSMKCFQRPRISNGQLTQVRYSSEHSPFISQR